MTSCRRSGLLPLAAALLCGPALAHHAPGHATSEGIRAVSSLAGQSARASQRALLMVELSQATDQPSGGAATNLVTSLVASFMPHSWLSLGAQLPWAVVDEQGSSELTSGYGDTSFELLLTPHGSKLKHRVPSFGLRLSVPTRTYELRADPGKLISASPFAAFTRNYAQFYWQVMGLSTLESRPAGLAWDASAGLSAGYRLESGLGGALGGWVDVRVLAYCEPPDGASSYCREGRVTENDRQTGATRGYLLGHFSYDVGAFSALAGAQLPVTPKRDFSWAAYLGAQLAF